MTTTDEWMKKEGGQMNIQERIVEQLISWCVMDLSYRGNMLLMDLSYRGNMLLMNLSYGGNMLLMENHLQVLTRY